MASGHANLGLAQHAGSPNPMMTRLGIMVRKMSGPQGEKLIKQHEQGVTGDTPPNRDNPTAVEK
jgi:hypothetical protein